jgi:disulfide bond formation protein DsbB
MLDSGKEINVFAGMGIGFAIICLIIKILYYPAEPVSLSIVMTAMIVSIGLAAYFAGLSLGYHLGYGKRDKECDTSNE